MNSIQIRAREIISAKFYIKLCNKIEKTSVFELETRRKFSTEISEINFDISAR
jgi:hypothetical protein